MEEKTWGCLKQTAIGCVVLIVLAIGFPIVLGLMMLGPFNRAVDARHTMEDQFGPQEAYVPPASGAPAADRIEIFLEVRRALAGPCADLTNVEEQFQRMESYDHEDAVNRMALMKDAFSMTKGMMGLGPVLGHLYEIRNRNLLDAGMGLGEFTYIFAVAYRDRLTNLPESDQLFGPSPTNQRIREALLSMLESQLDVARSEGGVEDGVTDLEAEIEAMKADTRRIPWQDGCPPSISEALAPYRVELDELYCPAIAPLELMINKRHGPAVESF